MPALRRAVTPLAALATLAAFTWVQPAAADVTVFSRSGPDVNVDLFGWVQPRFTTQQSDERPEVALDPNPAFTVQRARLGTSASLGTWARAQFEIDFAREIAQPIDAFVVLTPLSSPTASVSLTLGQFRVPFSRQNLLRSKSFQFTDPAYFIASKFIVDRDIGGMLSGDLLEGRARWAFGVFNGNDPGRGQTQNADPYFLYAARGEISPLGAPPRFEGDHRSAEDRKKPIVTLGAGGMRSRLEQKHFQRSYLGVDLGAWFGGASLYGEFYYHVDEPLVTEGPSATTLVKQMGWNVQAGYFLPFPFVREHLELAFRVHSIDPNIDVKTPANDSGARDLDQSNPTWGYLGFVVGLNFFWKYGHDLKLQANYEIRNETKRCLEGQVGGGCTGYIDNNLFTLQATAGF